MRKIIKLTSTIAVGVIMMGLTPHSYAAPLTKQIQQEQNHRQIIEQSEQLAIQGKAINSESFAIGSKGPDIQNKWGKPDSSTSSQDVYTYSKRNTDFFLFNDSVTHVVSYDKRYETITYNEVKLALGGPSKETRGDDGVYMTYECGEKLLVISFYYDKSGKNPDTINQVIVMDQYNTMTQEEKQMSIMKWPSLFK